MARGARVERLDGVALGDRDLGRVVDVARAAGRRRTPRAGAPARPRRRKAGATPSASRSRRAASSVGPAIASPTTSRPLDRGRDARAVADRGQRRGRARRPGRPARRRAGRASAAPRSRHRRRGGSPGARHRASASSRSARPARSPSGSHQPRSRASRSSRGTTSRRTSADRLERARLGRRLRGVERRTRHSARRRTSAGSGAWPYRAPSAAQRSRHATGVAAGTSRCAPASQTRLHDRGTTRYTSYPPPPVASQRPPAYRCATRVDQPRRLAHRGRRHAQVRERIPGVRIGAVLRHDEVRPERGGQLGEQHRGPPPATPPRRSPARAAR